HVRLPPRAMLWVERLPRGTNSAETCWLYLLCALLLQLKLGECCIDRLLATQLRLHERFLQRQLILQEPIQHGLRGRLKSIQHIGVDLGIRVDVIGVSLKRIKGREIMPGYRVDIFGYGRQAVIGLFLSQQTAVES